LGIWRAENTSAAVVMPRNLAAFDACHNIAGPT
jgi:hypothetical protein